MSYYRVVEFEGRKSAAFFVDGRHLSVDESHPAFNDVVQHLLEGDYEEAANLVDLETAVAESFKKVSERVSLAGGRLYFDGEPVENRLSSTIVAYYNDNKDFTPLVNFMENLYTNTSEYVREQLFNWLDDRNFTILPDGRFVAYKGVNKTSDGYLSVHSGQATVDGTVIKGRIPNDVGNIIEMPRSEVNDDPRVGCSTGLHAGTWRYASQWGDTVLTVAINPRDVGSVPNDCEFQKIRTCRYEVLNIAPSPLATAYVDYDTDDTDDTEDDFWSEFEDDEETYDEYLVPSSSTSQDHAVRVWSDGAIDCDCAGYQYRRNCKHVRAVESGRYSPSRTEVTV